MCSRRPLGPVHASITTSAHLEDRVFHPVKCFIEIEIDLSGEGPHDAPGSNRFVRLEFPRAVIFFKHFCRVEDTEEFKILRTDCDMNDGCAAALLERLPDNR